MIKQIKPGKSDKNLIFIKSLVISLGIILLVLIAVLFMLKFKRDKTLSDMNGCDNNLIIKTVGEVEKFELQGNNIVVLTKFNKEAGMQEIIKFDSACGKIISKTTFQIGDENE